MPPPRDRDEPLETDDLEMKGSFEEDDEPFERESFATRKARRQGEVKQQWYDALTVGIIGAGLMVPGVAVFWLTLVSMSRGWMDLDDEIIYAARDPGSFYTWMVFMGAFGVFVAQLGVRMVLHARREWRRTRRHARRVKRAGTRRR